MIKYIAVCAAHNEEEFIYRSLKSVLNQTLPPAICLLSDDGSTDKTVEIAEEMGVFVHENDSPRYKLNGINQVLALNEGIAKASVEVKDWDYLLKFDADTIISENYVESIISKMEQYKTLGICSGKPENEGVRLARASDASKIYKRQCWDEIGGLDVWVAFDSHAILKAAQKGWVTRTIPSIKFKELRPSGKYGLTRWILTGFERASFGFPLYHTVLASIKNVKWGSPAILNVFATIFSHIVDPWDKAPNIDPEFVKKFAIDEVRFFIKEIISQKVIKK